MSSGARVAQYRGAPLYSRDEYAGMLFRAASAAGAAAAAAGHGTHGTAANAARSVGKLCTRVAPDVRDALGRTAMHAAAHAGGEAALVKLLDNKVRAGQGRRGWCPY